MTATRDTENASAGQHRDAIAYLRSPDAIRERARAVLDAGIAGRLTHFSVALDALDQVADFVAKQTRARYPDLAIPYHSRWGHFDAGSVASGPAADGGRQALVRARLANLDPIARGQARFDLVITSVLLDAGAGPDWRYRDPKTGAVLTRSEGLAVASLHAFLAGGFASDAQNPLRADADALAAMDAQALARHFQVSPENPLVGVQGRADLLVRLGAAVRAAPDIFGAGDIPNDNPGNNPGASARVGGLFPYLVQKAQNGQLSARHILAAVLEGLGPIWPSRVKLGGVSLGDVWPHPAAHGPGPAASAGLVPFHKLSQWLSYSLVEPLEEYGLTITELDALTGLAEYRNGGLFIDLGVLVPKRPDALTRTYRPSDELVIEWRALTVALLDRVADPVRTRLGRSAAELPLTKILEGGTWHAGRAIAAERRPEGGPPIRIDSDGTVF